MVCRMWRAASGCGVLVDGVSDVVQPICWISLSTSVIPQTAPGFAISQAGRSLPQAASEVTLQPLFAPPSVIFPGFFLVRMLARIPQAAGNQDRYTWLDSSEGGLPSLCPAFVHAGVAHEEPTINHQKIELLRIEQSLLRRPVS
jgi:hypothetical protein